MDLISSFISFVSNFVKDVNDIPFSTCDGDLALPMSLGIFDPSHDIPLSLKEILLQKDEIIDTFLNMTLPSLHSNSLSSRDDAFVNDEAPSHSNACSSRDDALMHDESPSTFDSPCIDIEKVPSNKYSTFDLV